MAKRALAAIAAACAIGGCSMAPAYHPPVVPTPAHFKEDATWKPAEPVAALPRQWWQMLGDAQLDTLEQRIDTANPTLAIALARYDRARADLREARAAGLPHIGLGANLTSNRQSDNRPLRGAHQPDLYGAETIGAIRSPRARPRRRRAAT